MNDQDFGYTINNSPIVPKEFTEQSIEELNQRRQAVRPGTQIVYVPNHADDVKHPDCEEGFVTSVNGDFAWCRFWHRHEPDTLRTVANSERRNIENLIVKDTHSQKRINDFFNLTDVV